MISSLCQKAINVPSEIIKDVSFRNITRGSFANVLLRFCPWPCSCEYAEWAGSGGGHCGMLDMCMYIRQCYTSHTIISADAILLAGPRSGPPTSGTSRLQLTGMKIHCIYLKPIMISVVRLEFKHHINIILWVSSLEAAAQGKDF